MSFLQNSVFFQNSNGSSSSPAPPTISRWILVPDTSIVMEPNKKYAATGMDSTTFALPTSGIVAGDEIWVAPPSINDPNFISQQDGQTINIAGFTSDIGAGHGIKTTSYPALILLVATSPTDFNAYPVAGAWQTY